MTRATTADARVAVILVLLFLLATTHKYEQDGTGQNKDATNDTDDDTNNGTSTQTGFVSIDGRVIMGTISCFCRSGIDCNSLVTFDNG